MRAMRAEAFSGLPGFEASGTFRSRQVSDGRVVIKNHGGRGSTPTGAHHSVGRILTSESAAGAGGRRSRRGKRREEEQRFPVGSRVMFTGPYGISENGSYSEWLAVPKRESLA